MASLKSSPGTKQDVFILLKKVIRQGRIYVYTQGAN